MWVLRFAFIAGRNHVYYVLVAQLDKASDYESEDWGFKSLQGYFYSYGSACLFFLRKYLVAAKWAPVV